MNFQESIPGCFVTMMKLREIQDVARLAWIPAFCLVIAAGCEKTDLGKIDTRTDTPTLIEALLAIKEVNIDSLSPSNGNYLVFDTVQARLDSRGGMPGAVSVLVSVFRPHETNAVLVQSMRDDGVAPDARANDSTYTARFQFNLTRAQAGTYKVQVLARNDVGFSGNVIELSLLLKRNNAKPQLFDLQGPDSVEIPSQPQDSVNVIFRVSVADSDGLADVQQVLLRRIDPPPVVIIPLRDDGGLGPPFNFLDPNGVSVPRRSGDAVAGDGTFALTIPLLYSSTARTNLFGFQAIDTFGDTSASLIHFTTFFRRP